MELLTLAPAWRLPRGRECDTHPLPRPVGRTDLHLTAPETVSNKGWHC